MDVTNAERFLKSYNNIETQLKILYNAKATQNFTDLVKRCTELDITVRRYENELIDYGKLRNAIVHRSSGGRGETVIAVPCDEVVEQIEFIEKLLCHPPGIMDAIKVKKIASVFADKPLLTAVDAFAENWQKTLIVYDHGRMCGVLNSYGLYRILGERVRAGENVTQFLLTALCRDVLDENELAKYRLVGRSSTVFEIFKAFEERKGLLAVIVTENGQLGEKAINIITPSDFPRINHYLETYNVKPF